MAASNSGGGGPLSAEAAAALGEGLRLVFGRWTALQMAVENQWGGRDSRAKADKLGEFILSWFCDSKECQQGNYSLIEELRNSQVQGSAVFQNRQIAVGGNDDSDSSDDDDDASMMDDEAAGPEEMAVDNPRPINPVPDADGWIVVPPRRDRGRN